MHAPRLVTDRLVLRPHGPSDLDGVAALWADPAVVRFIGIAPSTRPEAWGRILRYAGLWALLGYGYWAVEETSSGRYVGDVGLADFARDIQPATDLPPETGWALHPSVHGRGYATEAVRAVLAWADAHLTAPRTTCLLDPANAASLNVARKCGYRPLLEATHKGAPSCVWARPRGG